MAAKIVLVFIITCSLHTTVKTALEPSYQSVQNILHERIEEIFGNDDNEVHLKVESGKFFRYVFTGDNTASLYEAYESGKSSLPHWLAFDSRKNKLIGVPTEQDIQTGLKIEFRVKHENGINGEIAATSHIFIDVIATTKKKFQHANECGDETRTVASLIFNSNLEHFDGVARTKVLRKLANKFDFGINEYYLESGNRMDSKSLLTSSIRMAGPGTAITEDQPGFTVSWKIKCGYELAGDATVGILRQLSQEENFSSISSVPIIGWFIVSTKANRMRRAADANKTPGVTPTVVGTPTLGPSPSVTVKPTGIVKPTPSKSKEIMTSTKPPTTPPVVITTTETTTTMTTKKTTVKVPGGNNPPEKIGNIPDVYVFENQALLTQIPPNLFYDQDPDDKLVIQLKTVATKMKNSTAIPAGSWLEYNNRDLYMFPTSNYVGIHRFMFTATDKAGEYATALFTVHVQPDDSASYNNVFNLTLDRSYSQINNSVQAKVDLVQTLATAQGFQDYKVIRAIQFLPGSIIIRWGIYVLQNSDCNNPELANYVKQLSRSDFRDSFAPDVVLSTGMMERKECLPLPPPDEGETGLWQRILIPVVVVVIVLLIILLVLCCVCRRKRKNDAHSDDEIYLNQKKKPIIFEEEKHKFLSLTSTSLSDDSPPINQNYGDSDGPGSSTTVSTENEGKALLTPSSPKDTSRGYNSPPPYGS